MKVLGYSDEITTCGHCGKTNLKGTYAMETETMGLLYFGSSCVNKAYGISKTFLDRAAARANRTGKPQTFVSI